MIAASPSSGNDTRWGDLVWREATVARMREVAGTPEALVAQSKRSRKFSSVPEWRAAQSERTIRQQAERPELLQNLCRTGKKASPESRERMRVAAQKREADKRERCNAAEATGASRNHA